MLSCIWHHRYILSSGPRLLNQALSCPLDMYTNCIALMLQQYKHAVLWNQTKNVCLLTQHCFWWDFNSSSCGINHPRYSFTIWKSVSEPAVFWIYSTTWPISITWKDKKEQNYNFEEPHTTSFIYTMTGEREAIALMIVILYFANT